MVPSHPDDELLRVVLLEEFRERREAAGIRLTAVGAAVGADPHAVWSLEMHRPANPKIATLVRYSQPCGFTLALDLVGVDEPATPEEATLQELGFVGTAMVSKLRRIRESRGISRREVQEKHGWAYDTFARIEYGNREPHLSTLQRYARVLGTRLDARWEAL